MRFRRTTALVVFGWVTISLACKLSAPTPVAWIGTPTAEVRARTQTAFASTRSAELTAMPTLPPIQTETATQTAAITPSPPPKEDGPWLLYPGKDGTSLHAYDLDAGIDTLLELPPLVNLTDLSDGLSPDENLLLLRAGREEILDELGLYAIKNPLEGVTQISPLLSIFLQRDIVNKIDENAPQALLAVSQDHGIAWSNDGQLVAFTAGLDGGLSDIYLYDLSNKTIERMTSRHWQNLLPFWSPNNNWLIFQETYALSQQTGWKPAAVFDVSLATFPNSRVLYTPSEDSLGEVMVDWINEEIFLSYSRSTAGGFDLRLVDVKIEKNALLYEANFSSVAFDPLNNTIALLIDNQDAADNSLSPGIYTAKNEGEMLTRLLFGNYSSLVWSEEGQLFSATGTNGITLFDKDGVVLNLLNEQSLAFSPGKNWLLAWNNSGAKPGLRLYTAQGALLQTITEMPINQIIWQPDSKGFFIVTPDGLYHVSFPLLNPVMINEDIYQGQDFHSAWLPEIP